MVEWGNGEIIDRGVPSIAARSRYRLSSSGGGWNISIIFSTVTSGNCTIWNALGFLGFVFVLRGGGGGARGEVGLVFKKKLKLKLKLKLKIK